MAKQGELYRIETPVFTSSGFDLALEILRRDHGSAVAFQVAQELVVYLKRSGGQNQFADIPKAQFAEDKELSRLISALNSNPGSDCTLDRLAVVSGKRNSPNAAPPA